MRRWLALLVLLAAACVVAQAQTAASPQEVRVAAASDLRFALELIVQEFEQRHPDVRVAVSYGSSGNFYAELLHGAPFDIFFSANSSYTAELERQGYVEPGTRARYAEGHLVIWAHDRLGLDPAALGPRVLTDPRVTKIVVASPQHAPYGEAAVEYLRARGAYDDLERRLVYGENASHASQIALQSGQVGILALSLAEHARMAEAGSYFLIPAAEHAPIHQEYVIVRGADRPEVRLFYDFVQSDGGRSILARNGFALP